jgi:hypothetical protein
MPVFAFADDEASNYTHVAAGPYGRCYAKSTPRHVYDNDEFARQQGITEIFRVGETEDSLINSFDWFAQTLFLDCTHSTGPIVTRVGPWQRGHEPNPDHLALAFYARGKLLKSYSTLDIAGGELNDKPSFSKYKNVSTSVSHYTVFKQQPTLVKVQTNDGPIFREDWLIKAVTIDGRELVFDPSTGELR